ncbi:Type I restriction modification DNA specificity domain-containing protein [Chryseobacterium joostei]|nr:restriction endonuclease subunit S [Chryseobacterium joostei]SIS36311.1 Type I restriction modification DNA specificity domain-containing protein [Chryseobacterium joostei]
MMELDLKNIQWGEFKISSIFQVEKGIYLNAKNIKKGNIPYISAKSTNNGLNSFIGNPYLFKGNKITIEKINLSAYYQPSDFYCSHDVTVISHDKLNRYNAIFVCNMINRQGFKYSYGRQAQMNICKNEIIYLPVNFQGEPDYAFMEKYMKQKEQEKIKKFQDYIAKRIERVKGYKEVELLDKKEWGEFFINELFSNIQRGKRLKKNDHIKGRKPYVSSSAMNNGVDGFINNKEKVRIFKNCLSIANSGSVGSTFYQPFEYVASDHVTKLENPDFNEFVYLFISGLTSRLSEKYSFNREINDKRIQREKILLPIDSKGQPDYGYMENYIKKLEYEKLTKYLKIKQ